jgi:hypothetical protein
MTNMRVVKMRMRVRCGLIEGFWENLSAAV